MRLLVDLHTHTVASGHAYSTVFENATVASKKGLAVIAITDHGPALPGGAHPYHFWNLRVLPDKIEGVRVLTGIEANVVNDQGELDLDNDALSELDVVLAGLHPLCGYEPGDRDQNTEVMIKAMSNPYVQVIVHPGNPWFPVDPDAVAAASMEYNVLLEMNNSSFLKSRPGGEVLSREIAQAVFDLGGNVILGSDAHLASLVGGLDEALDEVQKIGFTADRIMNTDIDRLMDFIKSKKG